MKKILVLLSILTSLAACSSSTSNNTLEAEKKDLSLNIVKDGSIDISRPVPAVTELKLENVLSFMPLQLQKSWVKIDLENDEILLMKGEKEISSWDADISESTKPGTYHLVLKEKNAPWYASDEYYKSRELNVPAHNSQERYLKSVLGENALFLENGLTIYSGIHKEDSIEGLRISDKAAGELFNALQAGDIIVIS